MAGRREKLEQLEVVTFESINAADPEKRAPLIAQMRGILSELEAIAAVEEKAGDPVDEIAARRAARGGVTARLGQSAGRKG